MGDFNGDGNLDLASANVQSNNVAVALGDGAGGFSSPRFLPTGGGPTSLAVGDWFRDLFQPDGLLDLVVVNRDDGTFQSFVGQGDGTFNNAGALDVGLSKPLGVVAHDFNGDGILDLAVAGSGSVSILLGQVNNFGVRAGFALPSVIDLGWGGNGDPRYLVVGDFNRDGIPDLAVVSSTLSPGIVSILLGDGTGAFRPPTNLRGIGSLPHVIASGDFNRDGAADLVVGDLGGPVLVLLNTCGGPIDLRPTAIEVTQAIQDLTNSVPLVADRRTFARVHVADPDFSVIGVGARLIGLDQNGNPLGPPLRPNNPGGAIDLRPKPNRGAINDSFLFELPASWIHAGTITLKAEINLDRLIQEPSFTNNSITSGPLVFQPTKALKVRLVSYRINFNVTERTSPAEFDFAERELRRKLPIATLDATRSEFFDESTDFNEVGAQFALGRIKWWRDTFHPNDRGVLYYGIPVGFDTVLALAEDIPGWNAFGNVSAIAHELGHLLGRFHAPCGGAAEPDPSYPYPNATIGGPTGDTARFYGFSPDLGVIPNTVLDEMSWCTPHWFSDYNYTAIRQYIQNTADIADRGLRNMFAMVLLQPVRTDAAIAALPRYFVGDFLSVYGVIDGPTQVVSSLTISRQPQVGEIPEQVPGPYRIQLFNTVDTLLAEYPFTPRPTTSHQAEMLLIAQVVPFVPGTRRIAIRSDVVGREITRVSVSANAPTVTITSRTGGPNLPSAGPVALTWDGLDADGDRLSYTVLYSADNRTTWRALATGITANSMTLDLGQLEGTRGAATGLFRVVVSDGVLTGFADSDLFSADGKAPVAQILSPPSGSVYEQGQTLTLEGVGRDLEDGILEDARLSWRSDRDGALGTGRLVNALLVSPGAHNITLTAVDSEGQVETTSIQVMWKKGDDGAPPEIRCAAPDGLWHPGDVSVSCTASDSESGLRSPADSSIVLRTSVPVGTETANAATGTSSVCDANRNCATAGPIAGNRVDKKAPTISINQPQATNYLPNTTLTLDYSVADGGSGVKQLTALLDGSPTLAGHGLASGQTINLRRDLALGPHRLKIDAVDAVRNAGALSVTFSIICCKIAITVTPASARRGQTISITGTVGNFSTTSQNVTLQFELISPITSKMGSFPLTLPANTNKSKTLPFKIPARAQLGTYTVKLTTVTSAGAIETLTTFTLNQ